MTAFLLAATATKVILAVFAGGTADVGQQLQQARAWASGLDVLDPANTGGNPSFFLVGHYAIVRAVLAAADFTGTTFTFWIKLPAIAADLGIACLLRRIPSAGDPAAFIYMASPVSLLLSVHHGQLHTVAAGGAALAVWLVEREREVAAGVILALAASVRHHFAVLVLPLARAARHHPGLAVAVFFAVVAAVNAPLLLASARPARVMSPAWWYGTWGYTVLLLQGPRILRLIGVETGAWLGGLTAAVLAYGAVLYWVWTAVWAGWVWWRPGVGPWRAALVFILGFYTVSPGFGVQWLVWVLPFWLVVDRRGTAGYCIVAGSFLAGIYWVWGFNAKYGLPSVTAELGRLGPFDLTLYLLVGLLGVGTWLYCMAAAWRHLRA